MTTATTPRTEHGSAPPGTSDAPRTGRPLVDADAPSRGSVVTFALGLAVAIVVAECLARRILAPTLPTIGSPTVNDMLAAALCYGLLVTFTAPAAARSPSVSHMAANIVATCIALAVGAL